MAVRLPLPRKKAPSPIDQPPGADAPPNACNEPGEAGCRTRHYLPAGAQKYESGANRIGASRLQQMSHILQVPVEFFFEGAPNALAPDGSGSALSMAQIDDFVADQMMRRSGGIGR